MLATYPESVNLPAPVDGSAEREAGMMMDAIRGLRNLRAELGIQPGRRLLGAAVMEPEGKPVIAAHADLIADMAKLTTLEIRSSAPSGDGRWVAASIAVGEVFIEIGEALDIEKELGRIAKDMTTIESESAGVQARLSNPQFLEKAAAAVIDKTRAQAAELEDKRAKLLARQALLSGER